MATVVSKTSAKIDELLDDTVASGSIDSDGNLTLMTRGGASLSAGSVVDPLHFFTSVDVNTLTEVGCYETNGGTNLPSGATDGFITVCGAGSNTSQTFQVKAGNRFWHRSRAAGTWTAWRELAPASSVITPLDAWPVGSIYMGVTSANPNTLLGGGTWTAWGTGRVPVGIDTGQTEFDTVEETGGTKTHLHGMTSAGAAVYAGGAVYTRTTDVGVPWFSNREFDASGSTVSLTPVSIGSDGVVEILGTSDAASTLQPYITCYMWKRTA